jgi:hypothetical protein
MTAEDVFGLIFVHVLTFGMSVVIHRIAVRFGSDYARSLRGMIISIVGVWVLFCCPAYYYHYMILRYGPEQGMAIVQRQTGSYVPALSDLPEKFLDPCPVCRRRAGVFCHPRARLDLTKATEESPIFINRPFRPWNPKGTP